MKTIFSFLIFSLPVIVAAQPDKSELRAICLPRPFKVIYPQKSDPLAANHPFQYKKEEYKGKLTVQIDSKKQFDLGDKLGIQIKDVDPRVSHTVKFSLNNKAIKEFKINFEDVNYDLVIDQKAYEGEFRTLPPKNKCPFKDTVSLIE